MKCRSIAPVLAGLLISAAAQAPAWAVPATPAAPAAGTAGGATAGAAATRTVELPTGDQVRVTTGPSGTHVTAMPGNGARGGGRYLTMSAGADTYVVPQTGQSKQGAALDPALFDVTHPVLASGWAQVAVTFRPGVTPHAIAGIRTTSVSGSTLDGVISKASAPAFGRMLARAAGAAQPASLAGVRRVASAVTRTGPRPASPSYAMETLTINIKTPASCACQLPGLTLSNVDGPNRYGKVLGGVDGPVTLSVPKGHYAAFANVSGQVGQGGPAADWIAGNAQFAVNHDMSITLDLGAAVSTPNVTTPKPSTTIGSADSIDRPGATVAGRHAGLAIGVINASGQPFPVFVAPTTQRVTVGALSYDFLFRQAGPDPDAPGYFYDLDFAGQGRVPADHSYVVSQAKLATIHESFGSVGPAYECPFPAHPWGEPSGGPCPGLATPASIDDYITADPQTYWVTAVTGYGTAITPTVVVGGRDRESPNSLFRTFTPGEQVNERWFSQPEAPNLLGNTGQQTLDPSGTSHFDTTNCAACANGFSLDLLLTARGTADTLGSLDPADSASYQVSADGVPLQGGDLSASAGQLVTTVPMPVTANTYRIDYDVSRDPAANPLSTSTQTTWQISAAARHDLPAGWRCTPTGGTDCSVVPLLDVVPDLSTSASGALAPGTRTGSLDVTQLGGGAVTVRSVKVQASYDGDTTWRTATISQAGNGQYMFRLKVPGTSDGFGDLRITAKAAGGATFSQTIAHAFAVSTS